MSDPCSCQDCAQKRERFMSIASSMSDGFGKSKKVISRHVNKIPDAFLTDLRSVLRKIRDDGGNKHLNKEHRNFFKTYKRSLREYVKPDVRQILVKKKRYGNKPTSFSQALGNMISKNPKVFKDLIDKTIHSHH